MPIPSNSDNSVRIKIKTDADKSGVNETVGSLKGLAGAVAAGQAGYSLFREAVNKSKEVLISSIDATNKYQSAMLGLQSITAAYNQDNNLATQAAKDLASDGLLTVSEAALGLKNLLASGFNLDQAIVLMNRFKDTAAFGRQSSLSFGAAVTSATEGIKNGNSILVDNAGVTKNLSIILQEHGKTQQDVMNITQDASVRQALYNGLIQETTAQVGNAEKLTSTYAGSQAKAAAQTEIFKQNLGGVVELATGGLLTAYSSMLGNNQQAIISFGASALAASGLTVAMLLAARAVQAFSLQALAAAATNPLLLALTALAAVAGVVVYKAVDKMQNKVSESNKKLEENAGTLGNKVPIGAQKAGVAMEKLGKKLGDIDKQIEKTNRDFQEQLAEMVRSHEDKVKNITQQLSDESKSFDEANAERTENYQTTLEKEAKDHQKKVDEIQKAINKQLSFGKYANKKELAELQQKLDEENQQYAEQSNEKQMQYEKDVAKAKESHDKKNADLTAELDSEKALLDKHAADVASIREVTLLDEIDKLKRSHDEQLAAFEQQRADAIANAQSTTSGISDVWNNANAGLNAQLAGMGANMGSQMGDAFLGAIKESFIEVGTDLLHLIETIARFLSPQGLYDLLKNKGNVMQTFVDEWTRASIGGNNSKFGKRATGGVVMSGHSYIVGDNPDGSFNSTTEIFTPSQSGVITKNSDMNRMLQSNSTNQVTNNYTIKEVTLSSAAAVREFFAINNRNSMLASNGMSMRR